MKKKKKKKKKERKKTTFREDKKGGLWVPYGQVTVISLHCILGEIMQTNNACEWRTKTGAPRGLANRGPSRG